jgi:hypothetical protein
MGRTHLTIGAPARLGLVSLALVLLWLAVLWAAG